jgi:hypothetical protein
MVNGEVVSVLWYEDTWRSGGIAPLLTWVLVDVGEYYSARI